MATPQQPAAFTIGPGFARRIAERNLTPLGPECYFAPGYSFLLTDQGPLWYSAYTGTVVGPFDEASEQLGPPPLRRP